MITYGGMWGNGGGGSENARLVVLQGWSCVQGWSMCADTHRGIVWVKGQKLLNPLYCGNEVYIKACMGWDGGEGVENASPLLWEWRIQEYGQIQDGWVRVESWGDQRGGCP